jgi:hypothetical protein
VSGPRDEWPRPEPLIDAVLDAAPDQRAALLAELSWGDAALHAHLARLVDECERPYPLLDRPAADPVQRDWVKARMLLRHELEA